MATRQVKVGKLKIGGGAPVSIQSMCSTLTSDAKATISQIHQLEDVGCEIIRVSVPDLASANALKEIKENISIPLVADIHFDHRLAIASAPYVDKLRINPGNIGDKDKIKSVVTAAKENSLPIRIGVNLGSLEKDLERQYGLTPNAMVESAFRHIKILEDLDFRDIIVSLKASDVPKTIQAYQLFSKKSDYPLHLGITESGSLYAGTINSSVGIGALLSQGIGDTIRVSLSADPVEEVKAGWQILKSLKLRKRGIEITSCPTCARAGIDVIGITKELEQKTSKIQIPKHIAVMGCAVNGPGEAKTADIGVVGSGEEGDCLFFRGGEFIKKINPKDIIQTIMGELK